MFQAAEKQSLNKTTSTDDDDDDGNDKSDESMKKCRLLDRNNRRTISLVQNYYESLESVSNLFIDLFKKYPIAANSPSRRTKIK